GWSQFANSLLEKIAPSGLGARLWYIVRPRPLIKRLRPEQRRGTRKMNPWHVSIHEANAGRGHHSRRLLTFNGTSFLPSSHASAKVRELEQPARAVEAVRPSHPTAPDFHRQL